MKLSDLTRDEVATIASVARTIKDDVERQSFFDYAAVYLRREGRDSSDLLAACKSAYDLFGKQT